MSMLAQGEKFQKAITRFTATTPDFENEGFKGYIEVNVIFDIKDIKLFAELWESSYIFPSEKSLWYQSIKNNFTWE